jgi:hypothetical protein
MTPNRYTVIFVVCVKKQAASGFVLLSEDGLDWLTSNKEYFQTCLQFIISAYKPRP